MCKLLFVSMCFWQCSFLGLLINYCRFDWSILILDKLWIYYVFIGIFFSFILINWSYFSNVTSTYYMEMK